MNVFNIVFHPLLLGSLSSMLAPEEEEVAALGWDVSAVVVAEAAATASLAAVDPGTFALNQLAKSFRGVKIYIRVKPVLHHHLISTYYE